MRLRFATLEEYQHYMAEDHLAMLKAIEPIVRAKLHACACMLPEITVHSDGRVEQKYSPADEALLARYDALIDETTKNWRARRDSNPLPLGS